MHEHIRTGVDVQSSALTASLTAMIRASLILCVAAFVGCSGAPTPTFDIAGLKPASDSGITPMPDAADDVDAGNAVDGAPASTDDAADSAAEDAQPDVVGLDVAVADVGIIDAGSKDAGQVIWPPEASPSEDSGPEALCCALNGGTGTYCGCASGLQISASCGGKVEQCEVLPGVCASGSPCNIVFLGGTSGGGKVP